MPFSSRRATQPAPMTPPPMAAAFFSTVMASPALLEGELLAHLGRADHPAAHGTGDSGGTLDQLSVARQHPLAEPDVVLQADADVAAGEHRHGGVGKLVAADGEGDRKSTRLNSSH